MFELVLGATVQAAATADPGLDLACQVILRYDFGTSLGALDQPLDLRVAVALLESGDDPRARAWIGVV
jgi:hypothetical protein